MKASTQEFTQSGFLACLIPEEFCGSGLGISEGAAILEEIHASGCNGGACHAQMYTMGTVLRHGNEEQKRMLLPGVASGKLRLQAFGVLSSGLRPPKVPAGPPEGWSWGPK